MRIVGLIATVLLFGCETDDRGHKCSVLVPDCTEKSRECFRECRLATYPSETPTWAFHDCLVHLCGCPLRCPQVRR